MEEIELEFFRKKNRRRGVLENPKTLMIGIEVLEGWGLKQHLKIRERCPIQMHVMSPSYERILFCYQLNFSISLANQPSKPVPILQLEISVPK